MLKFWSHISLLVQIAIVAGAVILFAFFDPFGLLSPRKLTLEDTPISVRSVKEIGKLITAEYYGEVLTSLQESRIDKWTQEIEDDEAEFESLDSMFQMAIRDLRERKDELNLKTRKTRNLYKVYNKLYGYLIDNPYYQNYISAAIWKYYSSKNKNEQNLIRDLYEIDSETKLTSKLGLISQAKSRFIQKKKNFMEVKTADKSFKKKQIVVLGRGSVKAGIDFGQFNEENFQYDQNARVIHLIGIKPEILVSHINPWFIPGKEKGFEIVMMTKKAEKPKYMLMVKQRSLEKLQQNAINAGILERAKSNAEDNLKSFFSLLIPAGVDQVVIHEDFFAYFGESILAEKITPLSMQSIDSLLVKKYSIDSAATMSMRNSLAERTIKINGELYPVDRYSSKLSFLDDDALTPAELNWLKNEKNSIIGEIDRLNKVEVYSDSIFANVDLLDSIWFFPEGDDFLKIQNQIRAAYNKEFSWYKIKSEADSYVAYQAKKRMAQALLVHQFMLKRKLGSFENLAAILRKGARQVVKGDVTYIVKDESNSSEQNTSEVNYMPSLEEYFQPFQGNIYQLSERIDEVLDIYEASSMNDLILKSHETNPKVVTGLVERARVNGRAAFMGDTLNVNRYSHFFQWVQNDTLSQDEFQQLKNMKSTIDSDEEMILQYKFDSLGIQLIDTIWYYPPKGLIKKFKKKADKKKFDTWFWQSDEREEQRELYVSRQIQLHMVGERMSDFNETANAVMVHSKVVELDGGFEANDITLTATLQQLLFPQDE
ncbi:MAG: DUF4230 domain-containing protein [Cyclobacteriaceae bacterium]|uniref:DUF4230 domain-containing protein n=1 Tax=Nonlabens ulvanivorans TaxID=906888 RepID=UPI00327BB83F